jgi:hypothetical protein
MELRKTQLAAAVGAALLVGGTAAHAQVAAGQQGIQVQLYGQVSRALMFADDGHQSKWFNVDAQPSSTRFGINASAQATPGLRVGAKIETEMKSNPSDTVNFGGSLGTTAGGPGPSTGAGGSVGGANGVVFAERWLDAFFEGSWGRINLGQGSGAADDASTIDLSGTGMANGNCVCDWGGGILWRLSDGSYLPSAVGSNNAIQATSVLNSHNNNDFESRYDRVMYTTPTFGGFRAQVGYGQKSGAGEVTEASLWYAGKLMGDLQAAIGYSNERLAVPATATTSEGPNNETIGGSVSWLHTSGFNVTVAYTQMTIGGASGLCVAASCASAAAGTQRDDVEFTWLKVGYKFGRHAIAVDYVMSDNAAAQGDEGKSYGVGYVWNPVPYLELFAGYRIYQLDREAALLPAGTSIEDVTVGQIGTRIRF